MSSLPSTISSPSDLTALILDVRRYAKWFLEATVAGRVRALHQDPQPEISPAAADMIRAWASETPLTSQRLDELIVTLEMILKRAPVVTITLAAPAPAEVKRTLVNWCRQEIDPEILVTLTFNATILGGMIVRVGSRVYDWSFRRQIMDNRRKFSEAVARV